MGAVFSANAALRSYGAAESNAIWNTPEASRLSCQLEHNIPRFGKARFLATASKDKPLHFTLDMLIKPEGYDVADVLSVPPIWKAGNPARSLFDANLLKQFDTELDSKASWLLLTELEKGNVPTFYYQDWHNSQDKIKVELSSVNFRRNYLSFLECRDALLPFSFDDIAYTVMRYESNSSELTRDSKKRLEKIGLYLENDPNIDSVVINAYTDSYGGRYINQQLSEKRADAIKSYMTEKGIAAEKIVTQGFGEKRHVATNNTIIGRGKNRRVVIQIEKV
ncbi:MAG: flagellar protein MotY [Pseudoalteromonas spongiae]|uniref:OmpA family protein n=1 Tax=Pseudoalteromonas spongiae TaxID=298657 RepID=A0ABU8EUL9_9GAMM|nr:MULTISPECIES: OmpA family protein [Pseudoalteromonas]MCF6458173.1 OmpA family protein [Pseudoalteromonas sp. MMG024]MEC8324936.1 OmpA family protein [Pseudomonadota bacterium]TMO82480.1 OmpA family protein [Pseudoalteromonas spongiae]